MKKFFLARHYGNTPVVPPVVPPIAKVFTQDEVNALLADHKKNLRAELDKTKKELEQLAKDKGNPQALEAKIQELSTALMTKEEILKAESEKQKLAYEAKLETETKGRTEWQGKYMDMILRQHIATAAIQNDAFDDEQLALILQPNTSVVPITDDKGQPIGGFKVVTKLTIEGKVLELPVTDAVAKMREMPKYANQFRVRGTSGTGETLNGRTGGSDNPDDPPEEPVKYMAWFKAQKAKGRFKK